MDIDISKLESLLAEKKYEEVRAIIRSAVAEEIPEKDRGALLTGLSSAYLDISNSINEAYRQALEEAVAGMKALNAAESKIGDKIRIAEVKASLNQA